jgi:hypothetical protein
MKLAKWLTLLAGQSLSSKLGLSLSDRMAKDVSLEEEVSECAALSNDSLPVPNIVHYIWFGCKRDFLPYHYLSVLSSLSVQNACKVFFHTDCEPPEDNELFSHLKEPVLTQFFFGLFITTPFVIKLNFFTWGLRIG